MKRLLAAAGLFACLGVAGLARAEGPTDAGGPIKGLGASFPAPVYQAWMKSYQTATGKALQYQPVNSGAGVQKIEAAAVDFGGSDKPLSDADLAKNGLNQFPTVLGGVVPVINMPGIPSGKLRLDGELLAAIFSGDVKMWDDARIKALNPGMKLPDWPITVVHRAEKSGTTFLFTSYLTSTSAKWKAERGASDVGSWPEGLIGVGNAGVPDIMKGTVGTIGYVEYYYAKQYHLDTVLLKNHEGVYVAPAPSAFKAAAARAQWPKSGGFYLLLLDQPGAKSWPITAATFVLVRKDAPADRREQVMRFFDWTWRHGDKDAAALDYVPLPDELKRLVRASWAAAATATPAP